MESLLRVMHEFLLVQARTAKTSEAEEGADLAGKEDRGATSLESIAEQAKVKTRGLTATTDEGRRESQGQSISDFYLQTG